MTDADWAASDKPVLACQDGCLRIMDLKLKTGSSPMEEHQLPGESEIIGQELTSAKERKRNRSLNIDGKNNRFLKE